MASYEYRLQALPLPVVGGGWIIKIWCREFNEDPDKTAWKCVYEQTKKYKSDGAFPSLYWKVIVQHTLA